MKVLLLALLMHSLSVDELELRTPQELAYEAWLTCIDITATYETQVKLNQPGLNIPELRMAERYLTNVLAVARNKNGGKDTPWATQFREAVEQETRSDGCKEGLTSAQQMYSRCSAKNLTSRICKEGFKAAEKMYPGLGN